MHKKSSPSSPHQHSSESSDDENPRPKAEGRADRFFYDTLMCQTPDMKFPETSKYRKCRESDTDKNDTEVSDVSKTLESSIAESDEMVFKKRMRRGKFAPFTHVVNFMGKGGKRN